VSGHVFLKIS